MNNDFSEFLDNESSAIKAMPKLMNKVFTWMFIGILVTAITSLITVNTPSLLNIVIGNIGVVIALIIAELALVFILSASARSLSYPTAIVAFMAYSIINGLTLSSIFLVYELSSIVNILFVTAGMFAILAVIGNTINIDLSRIGNILMIGLVGLLICSLINIFIMNSTFDLIVTIVGGLLFLVITVYDVQKIKNISNGITENQVNNISIICALTLYLDFVNIFLRLLRLFGRRRD